MTRAWTLTTIKTRLRRIARQAREAPGMVFTNLAHHIDVDLLREAYRRTRKDGAPGVDGQTADEYAANLEGNLEALLGRMKKWQYRPPPVRRTYIPKGTGEKRRPIGVPTFEDKILQRAVVMVLDAVCEEDFLDCSYGFRPGRSQHQALEALWNGLMRMRGGWVLEVDVQDYFDSMDHGHLRHFLELRVRDKALIRYIGRWLKAGVLEEGVVYHPRAGSPQGGVISPLLANIYLHEVMDKWFETEVKPRLGREAFLIRFADDMVIVFASKRDARRVMEVLPKRFGRYGLSLHPEKTRLVEFRKPRNGPRSQGGKRSGTFDMLGFTHYWGLSRKGKWVVKRRTAKGRFSRAVSAINQWLRRVRHWPKERQYAELRRKMQGHYGYYGITGNARALDRYRRAVERLWRKWLGRRSQRAHLSWTKMRRFLKRFRLPPARVVHSVYGRTVNLFS